MKLITNEFMLELLAVESGRRIQCLRIESGRYKDEIFLMFEMEVRRSEKFYLV
jgi:hypothetical protein